METHPLLWKLALNSNFCVSTAIISLNKITVFQRQHPLWTPSPSCSFWPPHLSCHYEARGFVRHFEDHTTIPCSQLTDLLKVIILQLPNLLLLGEECLQALTLLLVQLQLLQLLLKCLQIRPARERRAGGDRGQSESLHFCTCSRCLERPNLHSHPREMSCCNSDLSVLSQIKEWQTQNSQLPHPSGPAPVQACWVSPPAGVASWLCISGQRELLNHSTALQAIFSCVFSRLCCNFLQSLPKCFIDWFPQDCINNNSFRSF